MRIALATPVWKRHGLAAAVLRHSRRLADESTHDVALVVAGSEGSESRALADAVGATYLEVDNRPLGRKHNHLTTCARVLRCDAMMLVGSDDFVTEEWLARCIEEIEAGADIVTADELHLYDIATGRLCRWVGEWPDGRRAQIGAGRTYSRRVLETPGGPYESDLDSGLDGGLWAKVNPDPSTVRWLRVPAVLDVKGPDSLWSYDHVIESQATVLHEPLGRKWVAATYGCAVADDLFEL